MADVLDVAKYFITKVEHDAGDIITNLKLQKIVYYAQAWHLAIHGEPLMDAEFQAWAHGPVNYELYQEYRLKGSGPIPYPENFNPSVLTLDERKFLDEVWGAYGKFSAGYLRNLTHREDPWLEARNGRPEGAFCDDVISEKTMQSFYGGFIEDDE